MQNKSNLEQLLASEAVLAEHVKAKDNRVSNAIVPPREFVKLKPNGQWYLVLGVACEADLFGAETGVCGRTVLLLDTPEGFCYDDDVLERMEA